MTFNFNVQSSSLLLHSQSPFSLHVSTSALEMMKIVDTVISIGKAMLTDYQPEGFFAKLQFMYISHINIKHAYTQIKVKQAGKEK